MNFDNLFQNSGSKQTTTTSSPSSSSSSTQNPFAGLEQSLIQDGESILEKAAVGVVGALI